MKIEEIIENAEKYKRSDLCNISVSQLKEWKAERDEIALLLSKALKKLENIEEIQRNSTIQFGEGVLIKAEDGSLLGIVDFPKWIEEGTKLICPNCKTSFSDDILFVCHPDKVHLNFCPECGKRLNMCQK